MILFINDLISDGDSIVSRAQAKRLITRFENAQEITLDFTGVFFVGQSFVDEIFRVWKNNFPEKQLQAVNTNEDIDKMIKHVEANVIS